MAFRFRCGLRPSPEPPQLKFAAYFDATQLPPTPATFGHQNVLPADSWGVLANDQVGDCAIAGADHCSILWNKLAGRTVSFTDLDAIDDYSAITGYVSGNPNTDQGTDMLTGAKYWYNTGMRDNTATRHKIGAYLSVDPSNFDHIDAAAYLFDAVGLGVKLPQSAEDQFSEGQPWDVVAGSSISAMHFIPYIGRDTNYRYIISWGRLVPITDAFFKKYVIEVISYLSQEEMINGKNPQGFDYAALAADQGALA